MITCNRKCWSNSHLTRIGIITKLAYSCKTQLTGRLHVSTIFFPCYHTFWGILMLTCDKAMAHITYDQVLQLQTTTYVCDSTSLPFLHAFQYLYTFMKQKTEDTCVCWKVMLSNVFKKKNRFTILSETSKLKCEIQCICRYPNKLLGFRSSFARLSCCIISFGIWKHIWNIFVMWMSLL